MPLPLSEEVKLIEKNAALTKEIERLKSVEQELLSRNEMSQYVFMAQQRYPDRRIISPNDPLLERYTPELKAFSRKAVDEIFAEEKAKFEAAQKDRERLEEAQKRAAEREAARQAEADRIAENVKNFGHLRSANLEAFNELPDPMKATVLDMFGPGIVEGIRQKAASQMDWAAWDELKNIRPAKPEPKSAKEESSSKETKRELQPEDEDYDDSNGRYFFYREHLRATRQLKKSSAS